MLKRIGHDSVITSEPDVIRAADKIILPGVGAFDTGMKNLKNSGYLKVLEQKVLIEKTPILGICLGMQLMTKSSEEGTLKGLGWIDATTKKFQVSNKKKYKVPHMGWNYVIKSKENELIPFDEKDPSRFYFVHSYYVDLNDPQDELLKARFEQPFCAAFQKDNIFGVQFHPEKSHRFGKALLNNFASNFKISYP